MVEAARVWRPSGLPVCRESLWPAPGRWRRAMACSVHPRPGVSRNVPQDQPVFVRGETNRRRKHARRATGCAPVSIAFSPMQSAMRVASRSERVTEAMWPALARATLDPARASAVPRGDHDSPQPSTAAQSAIVVHWRCPITDEIRCRPPSPDVGRCRWHCRSM